MQFRCPNCQHPIQVADDPQADPDSVVDVIECPSCHSRFSLSAEEEATVASPPGMRIAHFDVLSVLGNGSFGTVYKAWDSELQREVAIKVPREGRVTQDTARLFMREARSAAGITHPNVVAVHEIGIHDGSHYIVTQYIDGISLAEYLKIHALSPQDAARLVIKLLRASQVFHDRSIVHRDLKPGNILLDADNEPHISDFGLARREDPTELTVTQSGRIVGTLAYMPPEQARGDQSAITNRSDIYALGVILYELLTGRRPFQSSSSRTLLYCILNDEPPRPRRVRREIPRDLETICLKAMEKDPQQRFQSASAMADALQCYLDGKPIPIRPVGPLTRGVKWVRRNRSVSAAACFALIALIVAVGAMLRPTIPGNAQQVIIESSPQADEIHFVLYDELRRTPHNSKWSQKVYGNEPAWLLPGFYKVYAWTDDGAFHEVWRTVPEPGNSQAIESRFPHLDYRRLDDGTVELPPVRLFRDDEVDAELVPIQGGAFRMGYEKPFGAMASQHVNEVADFQAGVHEISVADFRRVMNQKSHRGNRTWLDLFISAYGDAQLSDDNAPVTGYPVEVAVLYAELVGGRLPTNVEYEFLATARGTSDFPTGDVPAVAAEDEWQVLDRDSQTADLTPEGVRNLYNSVGEFTDSVLLPYVQTYPDGFPSAADDLKAPRDFPEDFKLVLRGKREIRGAPEQWLVSGEQDTTRNVRARTAIPTNLTLDSDVAEALQRVGWRVYRTRRPPD